MVGKVGPRISQERRVHDLGAGRRVSMASQQKMPDGEQTGRPEEVAAFSVALRGYDRDAVDTYLREHRAERREDVARREKAERRAADLEKELDKLRRQLAQAN